MANKPKIKYVKKLTEKPKYPVHEKRYPTAHEDADRAEKKAKPAMYKAERKAEYKLKKGELMATHKKDGEIEIEKKFKRFTPTLKIHETVEHEHDIPRKRKATKKKK